MVAGPRASGRHGRGSSTRASTWCHASLLGTHWPTLPLVWAQQGGQRALPYLAHCRGAGVDAARTSSGRSLVKATAALVEEASAPCAPLHQSASVASPWPAAVNWTRDMTARGSFGRYAGGASRRGPSRRRTVTTKRRPAAETVATSSRPDSWVLSQKSSATSVSPPTPRAAARKLRGP